MSLPARAGARRPRSSRFRRFVVLCDRFYEAIFEVRAPSLGRHGWHRFDVPLLIFDVPATAARLDLEPVLLPKAVLGPDLGDDVLGFGWSDRNFFGHSL
jgi:hypothetical protein